MEPFWRPVLRWLQKDSYGRIGIVLIALVSGALADAGHPRRLSEIGHEVRFTIYSSVSIAASQWDSWLGLSVLFSVTWLGLVALRGRRPRAPAQKRDGLGVLRGVVGLLVRNFGHLEAAFVWTVLVTWLTHGWAHHAFVVMFPGVAAVWALGLLVGTRLAGRLIPSLGLQGGASEGNILAVRRVLIALIALAGCALLATVQIDQRRALWPLLLAYGGSIAFRLLVLWLIQRRESGLRRRVDRARARSGAALRPAPQRPPVRARIPPRALLAPAILAAESADHAHRSELPPASSTTAAPAPGDVSLFIISDSQFHELTGQRSGVHLDLFGGVFAVAVRPVELDLLAGVTFRHFGDVYAERRRGAWRAAWWAHMGDFADLGCWRELGRAQRYVEAFATQRGAPDGEAPPHERLAALVPGNHDSTFFGNFVWHPDWETTCAPAGSERAQPPTKIDVDDWFFERMNKARSHRHMERPLSLSFWQMLNGGSQAFISFQELGTLAKGKLVAAFLDTSDYGGGVLGLAGVEGAISTPQLHALKASLCPTGPKSATAEHDYRDDEVVLFLHHPRSALTVRSRERLDDLVRCLDGRLLAIVSAHTHLAAPRVRPDDPVPELMVGSILDPPQEAELLTIKHDGAVRLETVPSVSRDPSGRDPVDVTLADCRAVYAALDDRGARPECHDLLHDSIDYDPPPTPDELKHGQQARARKLLRCAGIHLEGAKVVDDHTCIDESTTKLTPEACPLSSPELHDIVDATVLGDWSDKKRRNELVCLARAASLLQGHKKERWSFGRALQGAGDLTPDDAPIVVECPRRDAAHCTVDGRQIH